MAVTAILHAASPLQGVEQARKHLLLSLLLGGPIVIAGIVAAKPMLRFLFGPQFIPALNMAKILLAASLFQGMNQVCGAALRSLGKPGRTSIAEFAGLFVTVVLLVILLPRFGAVGAAVTSIATYCVVFVIQFALLGASAREPTMARPIS